MKDTRVKCHCIYVIFLCIAIKYITMKLLLWNVNGIRAISKKVVKGTSTFDSFIKPYDIVVLNETKINETALANTPLCQTHKYSYHSHSKKKQGYSGVSILSKIEPIAELAPPFEDEEGRLVILEYHTFILIAVYVPNSGVLDKRTNAPKRIDYRTTVWDKQFRSLCMKLEKVKPLIIAGDMNVAHEDIDVYNASRLHNHSGFTDSERDNFRKLLSSTSLIDVWRNKHPSTVKFSFFDYRTKARNRNAGWRIDYFLVSKSLDKKVSSCDILDSVYGSDHLPIRLVIN